MVDYGKNNLLGTILSLLTQKILLNRWKSGKEWIKKHIIYTLILIMMEDIFPHFLLQTQPIVSKMINQEHNTTQVSNKLSQ